MKSSEAAPLKRARPLLGTFVEVSLLPAETAADPKPAFEAAFGAIARVQRLMSRFEPESEISLISRETPGHWRAVDPWTIAVLSSAIELEELSEGTFRAAPQAHGPVPAPWLEVDVKRARVRRLASLSLDLGGIAKGFAVDRAVAALEPFLRSGKYSGAIVNAGGDARTAGAPTTLHVRAETADRPLLYPLCCRDIAIATSSAWPNDESGRIARLHRNGSDFSSRATVAVLAPECLWADALTKVALLADAAIVERCLRAKGARAIFFDERGLAREAA